VGPTRKYSQSLSLSTPSTGSRYTCFISTTRNNRRLAKIHRLYQLISYSNWKRITQTGVSVCHRLQWSFVTLKWQWVRKFQWTQTGMEGNISVGLHHYWTPTAN
jgi:hypothetical protein